MVVTQVQRGPAGRLARDLGVQGRPVLSFLCAPTPGDTVRRSLDLHDRSVRLRVWVDGQDVTGVVDDATATNPDIPEASAPRVPDVEVAMLRRQVEEQRALLRQLEASTAAATNFLELTLKEVGLAHGRHAAAQAQLEEGVKATQKNAHELKNLEMSHVTTQVAEMHKLENLNVKKLGELTQAAHDQLNLSLELQKAMRASLKPENWRDVIQATKDIAQVVVQGPLGSLANGVIQAMVGRQRGHDVSAGQILDMQVLASEHVRARIMQARNLLAALAPHAVTHTCAVTTDFLEGQLSLDALAHVLQTHLSRATVVQQGR